MYKKITGRLKNLKEILEIEKVASYEEHGIFFEKSYYNFKLNNYLGERIELKKSDSKNYRYRYKTFSIKKEWLTDIKEEIDWQKVPIDTKILVSDYGGEWKRRYFSGFDGGVVTAWHLGATSYSADTEKHWSYWNYAKLAEEDE